MWRGCGYSARRPCALTASVDDNETGRERKWSTCGFGSAGRPGAIDALSARGVVVVEERCDSSIWLSIEEVPR